jgi:hypothetical protein
METMTPSGKRPEKLLSKIIGELYHREKLLEGDIFAKLNKEAAPEGSRNRHTVNPESTFETANLW